MLTTIHKRRSIRKYCEKKVSEEQLQCVLEAIQASPSWKNKQCTQVIVVDDKALQKEIGTLLKNNPGETAYTNATYTLVFLADPAKSGNRDGKPYYMSDCAIAVEHAILCAAHMGLGTCWVGVFPEKELKTLLHIPEELRIVALSPLGYPNEEPEARGRKPLQDMVYRNYYEK